MKTKENAKRILFQISYWMILPISFLIIGISVYAASAAVTGTIKFNDGLSLAWDNGAADMFITTSGDVGINTTNPWYTLDVNGKIRMQSQTQTSDGNAIVTTKGYVDNIVVNSIIWQTVTPASTTCNYGGTHTLSPIDLAIYNGKYAIKYYYGALNCTGLVCVRYYTWTWSSCSCSTTDGCWP